MSNSIDRRDFLEQVGIVGAVALTAGGRAFAEDTSEADAVIATRPFGRSGRQVSILAMGGMYDINSNQVILRQCLKRGVTYWDTADCYNGGKSEEGIGMFFEKFPERRKDIFLVTKSDARDTGGMTKLLDRSLQRMKTDYIDLYFIHGVSRIEELNDETKQWAEKAKKDGRIKLFGFSTHKNMQDCMQGAVRLGWIDGIMMKHDFRLMHEDSMQAAVEACAKAGIGLTAMKTQGGGPVKADSEEALRLAGRFLARGFSEHQAKLKAVWEAPGIASICSQMPNLQVLNANIAAALDRTQLAYSDHAILKAYAGVTSGGYCAGCASQCEPVSGAPVSDVMRCLMYHHTYGDRDLARTVFAGLPGDVRARLPGLDFAAAEAACPQKLPIGRLMREASGLLG